MFMESLMDTLASFHRLMWIRLISDSKLAVGVNVVSLFCTVTHWCPGRFSPYDSWRLGGWTLAIINKVFTV